jgi:seryl-tRNA synthetase
MHQITKDSPLSLMNRLYQRTGDGGVLGNTALYERVLEGLGQFIATMRDDDTEIVRFPPIMSRAQVERSGYHKSFPHLLGCVCSLHGGEAEVRSLLETTKAGSSWTDALDATDLVLTPAACYPLYPMAAERGAVPANGYKFDVASYCFRREATSELGRLQSFRMREFVRVGTAEQTFEFRERWIAQVEDFAQRLGLPHQIAAASDPFFGRAGKLMAASQVEQSLKFELLIPIRPGEEPTACMSFNYHRDQFGSTWNIKAASGELAHSSCVAFGIDRLTLALFATHGLEIASWPQSVRSALSL